MTPAPALPAHTGKRWRVWIFVLAIAALAALALTTRSFWIDECYSARFAQQPTLSACWNLLREIKGSDPQMPFYILWIWSCEKIVGASELALRAVNFLWFIPALVVLVRAFGGNRSLQSAVFAAAVCSPFVWYYLNEARAYTMQFSTGMVLFALVCQWIREPATPVATERARVLTFAVALVLLCGSSILSMVLAVTPLLLALVLLPRQRCMELLRHFWLVWTATLALLMSLGIYYLWTLLSGDRATAIASSDWKNFVFVGYELTGFSGWGPGRLEIRSQGLGVFRPYAVGLLTYGLVMAALIGLAAGDLKRRFGAGKIWLVFFATILPSAFLVTASAFQHFRILGRHHAAMLPAAIILFGFCVTSAWRRGRTGRILVLVFFGLQLASALSLRFAARHEKDDYRAAAAFAKGALNAGQTVWWNADANAAIYYGVPLTRYGSPESGRAYWVIHATPEQLAGLTAPAAIVTSRPDVYDELGNLARFAVASGYQADARLVAFKLWTLKP